MLLRAAPLLLCCCASMRRVERYEVKPETPPADVIAAANTAAKRLGANVTDADGGTSFELRGARGLIDQVTVSSPDAGVLAFDSSGVTGMGTVGGVLTAATQQQLDDRPTVTRHEKRSHLPVLLLDLTVPFVGGMLADAGDPYGPQWVARFAWLALDVLAVALLLDDRLLPRLPRDGWSLTATAITMLVVNRLGAAFADWLQIDRRNRAVDSGFDLGVLPEAFSRSPPG